MSGEIQKAVALTTLALSGTACSPLANVARTALAESPTPIATTNVLTRVANGVNVALTGSAMPSNTPIPSETPKPPTATPTKSNTPSSLYILPPAGRSVAVGGASTIIAPTSTPEPTNTLRATNTNTSTPSPTLSSAAFTATAELTPPPSNTPTRLRSTNVGTRVSTEQAPSGSSVTIKGAPVSVNQSDLKIFTNNGVDADGVDHKNKIGLGSEIFIGEPGVLVVSKQEEVGPSAWLNTADKQVTFTQPGPSYFGASEGAFVKASSGALKVTFKDAKGNDVVIDLKAVLNNVYYLLIKGYERDGSTPVDNNSQMIWTDYNPGYTQITRFPPGTLVSEGAFNQDIASAHNGVDNVGGSSINCGADGCPKVTAVMYDAQTGAYTIIEQNGLNGQWKLVKSNIK